MAFARDVYEVTDAAGETDFNVNFAYLQKSHVKVSVNGTATTDFNWLNDGQIQLVTAAPFGAIVVLTRETSPAERLVDYQTGSVLSEEILDTDSLQGFFLAQEANDVKELTLAKSALDQWDATNRRLTNLADPIDNNDAVNKGFISTSLPAINAVNASLTQITNVGNSITEIQSVAGTLDAIEEIAAGGTATEIAGFNNYYKHGNTAPAQLEGRMWFDTQTDTLKISDGSTFQPYNTSVQTEFQGLSVNSDGILQWTHGTANNTFDTSDYADWFFALSDITILIDTDGHLKVRY